MGYRTVVILENDRSNEWMNDPELGRKIYNASLSGLSGATNQYDPNRMLGYGTVIECTHADVQSMVVIDGYNAVPVSSSIWRPNDDARAMLIRLLREAVQKMGFQIVKKPEVSQDV